MHKHTERLCPQKYLYSSYLRVAAFSRAFCGGAARVTGAAVTAEFCLVGMGKSKEVRFREDYVYTYTGCI